MQPADLPSGPSPSPELITRLERLERRHDLLWRMVDTLLDHALDDVDRGLTAEQSRQERAAAMKAAVAAAVDTANQLRTTAAIPQQVMGQAVP